MVIVNIIATVFPLIPLWLILKDNNVHLGTVPIVMIVAYSIYVGITLHVLDKHRTTSAKYETFYRVQMFLHLHRLQESVKQIEKLQKDVAHLTMTSKQHRGE